MSSSLNALAPPSQRLSRSFLGAICILGGLYFLTRLGSLSVLPVFLDEAVHIQWAERLYGEGRILRPVGSGRLLAVAAYGLALPFEDRLWAARCVAVLVGAVSLLLTVVLSHRLFGPRAAAVAGGLYVLSPFALVYDRLALSDGFLSMSIVGLMLATWIVVQDPLRAGPRAGLAILIVLAVCSKVSALLFFFVVPVGTVDPDQRPAAGLPTVGRGVHDRASRRFADVVALRLEWRRSLGSAHRGSARRGLRHPVDRSRHARLGGVLLFGAGPGLRRCLRHSPARWPGPLARRIRGPALPSLRPLLTTLVRSLRLAHPAPSPHSGGRRNRRRGRPPQTIPWPVHRFRPGRLDLPARRLFSIEIFFSIPQRAPFPRDDRLQLVTGWPSGYGVRELSARLKQEAERRPTHGVCRHRRNQNNAHQPRPPARPPSLGPARRGRPGIGRLSSPDDRGGAEGSDVRDHRSPARRSRPSSPSSKE